MDAHSKTAPLPAGPQRKQSMLAALVTALLLFASLPSGAAEWVDREFDAAVRSFKAGRTSDAYGQFQDLANRGDVDSARIALFLSAYGPLLYGKHWDALPHQIAHWEQLVRNSGTSARVPPEFAPRPAATARKPRSATANHASALNTVSAAR